MLLLFSPSRYDLPLHKGPCSDHRPYLQTSALHVRYHPRVRLSFSARSTPYHYFRPAYLRPSAETGTPHDPSHLKLRDLTMEKRGRNACWKCKGESAVSADPSRRALLTPPKSVGSDAPWRDLSAATALGPSTSVNTVSSYCGERMPWLGASALEDRVCMCLPSALS